MKFDFNSFQDKCAEFDIVEGPANGKLWYYGLKLCGEAGELAEKIGKLFRDGIKDGQTSTGLVTLTADDVTRTRPQDLPWSFRLAVAKELGDVLWYVARLAYWFGFTLEQIAALNVEKLESRKQRGVLGGSGDNR